jgi:CRP/FNR family transcriptional regulator, cyclic AMP receptor protein
MLLETVTDETIQTLSRMALFAGCNQRELREVARLCTPLRIEEGFVLTTEGTPAHECFLIVDGKAQVALGGRPIGMVGAGECVGEMALVDGGCRTATVTAVTPMNTYLVSGHDFYSLLKVSPTILRKLAATIAHRLRVLEAAE